MDVLIGVFWGAGLAEPTVSLLELLDWLEQRVLLDALLSCIIANLGNPDSLRAEPEKVGSSAARVEVFELILRTI